MEGIKQYLIPYIISNIAFGLTILAAWKKPWWARVFLTIAFIAACGINSFTALETPEVYLEYGKLALLPAYRNFIYGFFSERISSFVSTVAFGQFLIAFGLTMNKGWTKAACIGGAIFGLAIAALGVGSAFPATVSMSVAFLILFRRQGHDFIWKWNQYAGPVDNLPFPV